MFNQVRMVKQGQVPRYKGTNLMENITVLNNV